MPLKAYCTGLLLPGERKTLEPIGACLAPHNIQPTHHSLHHSAADAFWSHETLLPQVRTYALPAMSNHEPVVG